MDILVVGLGVIGATYGYLFSKAGHRVEHFLRKGSPKASIGRLNVDLLDGRINAKGVAVSDVYNVEHCSRKHYDFIFVSVPSGGWSGVAKTLVDEGISGNVLLCSGIWDERSAVSEKFGQNYVLGYPVAGGNIVGNTLTCCVFDYFMLERGERAAIADCAQLESLFGSCSIKLERPHDMLEWIWLHMAINAAVVAVAGKHGSVGDTAASAEGLMDSSAKLAEAVRTIRETVAIVAARGVCLRNYRNELWAYRLPTWLSAPLMKRMFRNNIMTRKIMTLHGNVDDLRFVCQCLYDSGKRLGIDAPVFYGAVETVLCG